MASVTLSASNVYARGTVPLAALCCCSRTAMERPKDPWRQLRLLNRKGGRAALTGPRHRPGCGRNRSPAGSPSALHVWFAGSRCPRPVGPRSGGAADDLRRRRPCTGEEGFGGGEELVGAFQVG